MWEQIRLRLAFALGRFARRIRDVTTSLADVNGRKGGVDKRCRLEVRLSPRGQVTIEEMDANLFAAIARAAGRAGQSVGRALKRRRDARIHRGRFTPRRTE